MPRLRRFEVPGARQRSFGDPPVGDAQPRGARPITSTRPPGGPLAHEGMQADGIADRPVRVGERRMGPLLHVARGCAQSQGLAGTLFLLPALICRQLGELKPQDAAQRYEQVLDQVVTLLQGSIELDQERQDPLMGQVTHTDPPRGVFNLFRSLKPRIEFSFVQILDMHGRFLDMHVRIPAKARGIVQILDSSGCWSVTRADLVCVLLPSVEEHHCYDLVAMGALNLELDPARVSERFTRCQNGASTEA